MATTLQALLNIRANVQGEGAVAGLGKAIGGIQGKAAATTGALRGLTGSLGMGGLAGAMGALTPLLTAAGLASMAHGAITAADNMNDLRQKTGVSVEALSQFGRAAEMSGTTIDGVAGAMAKLARGMTATKGPAVDAMHSMGIASRDASGNLRSVDEVMLEVADKFKTMPDGAQKSALAVALFGKAGADMIPMLNMGSAAIKELGATMSGEFAAQADELNDKLAVIQGSLTKVAVQLATALMPALQLAADTVGVLAAGLGQLPGPLQTLVVSAALIAIAWGPIVGTFAALAGVIGTVGPLLTGLGAVIAGFITWPVLLVAGLVAAGVAIFAFRDQIMAFFTWWAKTSTDTLTALGKALYTLYVQPFVEAWDGMKTAAQAFFTWLPTGWTAFSKFATGIFTAIGTAFSKFFVDPVRKAFTIVVDAGKQALRGLLQWAANAINGVINLMNRVIAGINRVRGALGLSTFGTIGNVTVPAFAEGAFVTGPTLAMVGDNKGGREYIVPEGKAERFAQNYLAGARGAAAIPSSTSASTGGGGPVTVNLTTGPLQQLPDGRGGLPIEDVQKLVRQAVIGAMRQARTPAGRYAMGG
jgi:hypothetical protein